MRRRTAGIAAFAFLAAVSVVFASQPAEAAGTLVVDSSTVAAGADLRYTAADCPFQEHPGWSQEPKVVLVSGTAPNEILAGFSFSGDDSGQGSYVVHVPLWVDPAAPAALVGECIRTDFTPPNPEVWVTTVQFVFPEVPIDITPKNSSATGPIFVPQRTSAAGGQVILEAATGCAPNEAASVILYEGSDLSGRHLGNGARYDEARTGPHGSGTVELTLLTDPERPGPSGTLPEGTYTAIGSCGDSAWYERQFAAPHLITVAGTNPSAEFDLRVAAGRIVGSGAGCGGGHEATVTMAEWDHPALPTILATPDIDGNWIGDVPEPSRRPYAIIATADCGDASADGFRYVPRFVQGGHDDPPPVEESDPQSQSLETPTATAADPIPGSPTLTG